MCAKTAKSANFDTAFGRQSVANRIQDCFNYLSGILLCDFRKFYAQLSNEL